MSSIAFRIRIQSLFAIKEDLYLAPNWYALDTVWSEIKSWYLHGTQVTITNPVAKETRTFTR